MAGGVLRRDLGGLRQGDFHELAGAERIVERLDERVGEALMPHVHERREVMSLGAQLSAFL